MQRPSFLTSAYEGVRLRRDPDCARRIADYFEARVDSPDAVFELVRHRCGVTRVEWDLMLRATAPEGEPS